MQRLRQTIETLGQRLVCVVRGHMWDSDRPAGPTHLRDICWRCDAVRGV